MIIIFIILILICLFIIFLSFKSFKSDKYNMFFYNLGKYTLGYIFKFYYPYKVKNKKYGQVDGKVIYASNHIHLMDQCLTILEVNRTIHYMAKNEYFLNPKTRWFFKSVGCIPVNREIKDEEAKEKALEVLENNLALGIFPEGTRNKTNKLLLPFKYGAVSFAKKTKATIVPIAITGDYKFRTKNLKITFGKPFKVDDLSLEEANKLLYDTILKLVKEGKND